MKNETRLWVDFSIENLKSARILLKSELYNPSLQNIQQSIEKALKAVLIEKALKFKKTHSITELNYILLQKGIDVEITVEDCEFIDSIYLPSKYPISQVLPDYEPTGEICQKGIEIAESVLKSVQDILK